MPVAAAAAAAEGERGADETSLSSGSIIVGATSWRLFFFSASFFSDLLCLYADGGEGRFFFLMFPAFIL